MLLTSLIETNNLEPAIAYNPLIVTPDTLVSDAIALMSNARATCTLENISGDTNYLLADARASCVLVMEDKQLIGIFTKRDVVQLSAEGRQIGDVMISEVMTHNVITIQQSDFHDLFAVLNIFRRHRIRHLPILDDHHNLLGLITHENLRQLLRPIDLLQLRLVSEVMTIRVVYTERETSILDITKLMTKEKVSSVVIIEAKNSLLIPIGIITERDIVQFQAMNLDLDDIQVQTVMSSPVFSTSPDNNLWSVLMLMEERRIHRIVITGEQGELLGFMTYTSLLQALNPLDIYKVVQGLEHKVSALETEKLELLQNRNTELEAEVKKRTGELQAQTERERLVSAIANRIRTSLNLGEILNSLSIEVRKVLNCDRVLVYQLNANGSGIVIAEDVTSGWLSFQGEEVFDPCFAQNWIETYVHGRIRVVNDIHTDGMTSCHQQLLERLQIRAKILVPIIVKEQLWGLMVACQNDAPRIWQQEETELLQQLSTHVSIAIQQAELYHRLQLELQERKQAEIALSKSEERLRTIVETSGSGLVTVDKQGKILFVNPAAARMFGRNIPELHGWPFALPYNCDSHQVQEIEILQPDGQQRKVNMEAASIPWNSENAFLMSLSDITELKQTEELLRQSEGKYRLLVENLQIAEAQLQQWNEELEAKVEQRTIALKESQYLVQRITEATPDILYIYDLHEKRNIYINREIARLIGYSSQEIQDIGDELFIKIMHPDDLPLVTDHHNSFITASDEEIREIEYRMCDRYGNWHWFLSHDTVFNRDSNNLPKQIIGAASEISERKQIEAKLRQSHDELVHATQLKDEFLANMSHELRTPLNAILGMSEGLQSEVFGQINDRQKQAINTIEHSGKHLLELINDILDLSKIAAGKLELQLASISCRSLCDCSLIFVKQQSLQKNIEISVEVPVNLPEIMVDERRFRQILINLLNNAVKFTHNGGKIQLVVAQIEEENGPAENFPIPNSSQWIRFSVIDNGIGIAEADLDKLFQPFIQIDSSLNRQYNGTGLGLSLVRQLVELHQGKITVTSEVDHGSSFHVYIPYTQEAKIRNNVLATGTHNQEATASITGNYIHKKSASIILLGEETNANITTIFNYLQARGYRVILAQHSQECLNIIKGENPGIIIIDIPILEINGIETIKLLRANQQLQDTPIIVLHNLTTSSDESDQQSYQEKWIAVGANEYFIKPVKLKIILDKIQTLLSKH